MRQLKYVFSLKYFNNYIIECFSTYLMFVFDYEMLKSDVTYMGFDFAIKFTFPSVLFILCYCSTANLKINCMGTSGHTMIYVCYNC